MLTYSLYFNIGDSILHQPEGNVWSALQQVHLMPGNSVKKIAPFKEIRILLVLIKESEMVREAIREIKP